MLYTLTYMMTKKYPDEARDYCANRGERIVYIDSEEKQEVVTKMSGKRYKQTYVNNCFLRRFTHIYRKERSPSMVEIIF